MIKQKEIEELIKSGFDLDLISFEFEVPIELVRQCKIDLEKSKLNNNPQNTINQENNRAYSKMENMRRRYKQLYYSSNRVKATERETLSQQDIELIEHVVAKIEKKIQEMQDLSKPERRKLASEILSELKKIEEYQLPIDQAEKVYMLMCSKELNGLNMSVVDKIDYVIISKKRKIATQFAKIIELEQQEVEDIEELKKLERKITSEILKENPISIGAVKSRISNRIAAKQQQQAIDKIRGELTTNLTSVITDLVNGKIDIQNAREVIDKEAKKRVKSKPNNKFSLTEEQQRRQIIIQMRTAIAEKSDKYFIQDPEKTALQMSELSGGELEASIRMVVKNLIGRKDFESAKSICDKFSKKSKKDDTENERIKYIRGLRNEIRNAEISDIVLKAINMKGTAEQDRACLELIEKGLEKGNVKLSVIFLGKSEDGLRNITLADIWEDEVQQGKLR